MKPVKPTHLTVEQIREEVLASHGYGPRVIHFMDGPLVGLIHEVQDGWPCPDRIRRKISDTTEARYVIDSKGHATLSELVCITDSTRDAE